MKLLYDFRAYQEFYPRGVSRYVYELFTRVIKRNDGINAILVNCEKMLPNFNNDIQSKIVVYDVKRFMYDDIHETFDIFINGSTTWLGLPHINALDVLYPEEVIKHCKKKVCILYDFVPLLYSHYLPTEIDQINYFLQCEAIKYMDHVFTISKYISSSGARYLNRPLEDFTCLYGGADEKIFHSSNSNKEYDPSNRNHTLVNVSGICVRKNFEGVTAAFCKAYKSGKIPSDAKLVIICSASDEFVELIKQQTNNEGLKFGKHVVTTGFISDTEMVNLISMAHSSIYPSLYEGLGLPVLESYMAGTPCIGSNVSSIKELILEKATFNPFDVNDMSTRIVDVYNDERLCKDSLAFGRALLNEINWESSANIFIKTLKGMV